MKALSEGRDIASADMKNVAQFHSTRRPKKTDSTEKRIERGGGGDLMYTSYNRNYKSTSHYATYMPSLTITLSINRRRPDLLKYRGSLCMELNYSKVM